VDAAFLDALHLSGQDATQSDLLISRRHVGKAARFGLPSCCSSIRRAFPWRRSHHDRYSDRLYELLPAVYRLRDASKAMPSRRCWMSLLSRSAWWRTISAGSTTAGSSRPARMAGALHRRPAGRARTAPDGDRLHAEGLRGQYARLPAAQGHGHDARTTGPRYNALACPGGGIFQLLETTQYINHLRPSNLRTPDLRQANSLELLDSPSTRSHTRPTSVALRLAEATQHPQCGLFLWRLRNYTLENVKPCPWAVLSDGRFFFSPWAIQLRSSTGLVPRRQSLTWPRRLTCLTPSGRQPSILICRII